MADLALAVHSTVELLVPSQAVDPRETLPALLADDRGDLHQFLPTMLRALVHGQIVIIGGHEFEAALRDSVLVELLLLYERFAQPIVHSHVIYKKKRDGKRTLGLCLTTRGSLKCYMTGKTVRKKSCKRMHSKVVIACECGYRR